MSKPEFIEAEVTKVTSRYKSDDGYHVEVKYATAFGKGNITLIQKFKEAADSIVVGSKIEVLL